VQAGQLTTPSSDESDQPANEAALDAANLLEGCAGADSPKHSPALASLVPDSPPSTHVKSASKSGRNRPEDRQQILALPTVAPPFVPQPFAQSLQSSAPTQNGITKEDQVGSNKGLSVASSPPSSAGLELTGPASASKLAAPGKLAFGLRLTPETEAAKSDDAPESPASSAGSRGSYFQIGTTRETLPDMLQSESGHQGSSSNDNPQALAPVLPQETAQSSQPKFEEVNKAVASDLEPEKPVSHEPLRDLRVQLTDGANQRVDVHFSDRGGQLHVSVRSGDLNLTQSLQERIPDLTAKLQQHRFTTEVYIPQPAESSSRRGANADHSREHHHSDTDPNGSGREQNRRYRQTPDWDDELASQTFKSSSRSSSTWLQ